MTMSFSFAEIQDITLKNSAFSQSFNLPGSKKNNEVFDYYYDVSSIPTNFNPNEKFPAIILGTDKKSYKAIFVSRT